MSLKCTSPFLSALKRKTEIKPEFCGLTQISMFLNTSKLKVVKDKLKIFLILNIKEYHSCQIIAHVRPRNQKKH